MSFSFDSENAGDPVGSLMEFDKQQFAVPGRQRGPAATQVSLLQTVIVRRSGGHAIP